MQSKTTDTAILFFSRSPQDEALAKVLLAKKPPREGIRLARTLIRHTLHTIRSTGLPVFTCYSPQQHGDGFGERLANALDSIYSTGYQRIIVIGNDSPQLRTAHLLRAVGQLDAHDCVWGPSPDGGVYLLALHRDAYQREAFIQLAWETPRLCATLAAYSAEHGLSTDTLPPLLDIDTPADWQRLLSRLHRGGVLWRRFRAWLLLPTPRRYVVQVATYTNAPYSPDCAMRGPPLF